MSPPLSVLLAVAILTFACPKRAAAQPVGPVIVIGGQVARYSVRVAGYFIKGAISGAGQTYGKKKMDEWLGTKPSRPDDPAVCPIPPVALQDQRKLLVLELTDSRWSNYTPAHYCAIAVDEDQGHCQPCDFDERRSLCPSRAEIAVPIRCDSSDQCLPLEIAIAEDKERERLRRIEEERRIFVQSLRDFRCDSTREINWSDDRLYPPGEFVTRDNTNMLPVYHEPKKPRDPYDIVGNVRPRMKTRLISDPRYSQGRSAEGPYKFVCVSFVNFEKNSSYERNVHVYGFVPRENFMPDDLKIADRFR